MTSPGTGVRVMAVPDVVIDDADAEHDVLDGQEEPPIAKATEVTGAIPGLVAVRVYGKPGWLIFRSENEAMPPLTGTMTVPDSVTEPGFNPTETTALEAVASWPDPSRTSTLT